MKSSENKFIFDFLKFNKFKFYILCFFMKA